MAQTVGETGDRGRLRALDAALAAAPGGGDAPSAELLAAAAAALSATLVRELQLEREDTPEAGEPVLRFARSEVRLFPARMVEAHLRGSHREGTPVRLERLVDSTAAYLDHLVRYFPSRLGLERRSRGARRDARPT